MSDRETTYFPLLYFGPIAYYRRIAQSKNSVFVSNERFAKQTHRSRCDIYGANGKLTLSIPVNRPFGNRTRLNEVQLSDATPWLQTHWKSIKSAYGRAPYFDYYAPQIEELYANQYDSLASFLEEIHKRTHHWLDITPSPIQEIEMTTSVQQTLDQSLIAMKSDHNQYWQVFQDKLGFLPNLSILDLLFNEGPQGQMIIHR